MHTTENKIFEYLNGSLSELDRQQVEKWIAESSSNQQEFEDYKKVFVQTARSVDQFEPNVEAAWKKVEARLFTQRSGKQVQMINWAMLTRIAAVVVLALGVGFIAYQQIQKDQIVTIATVDNQTRDIQLSDGTVVTLNENSSLTFDKSFDDQSRQVALKGQAFFAVERDEKRPFQIMGLTGTVEVLGTSFDVLSIEGLTTVNVATGKVSLSANAHPDKKVFLEKGQQGVLKGETLLMYNSVDNERISWRFEELAFKSTPLSEVVKVLSKHYNVQFEMDSSLGNCLITSSFKKLDLDEVLKTLELIANIKNTREKDTIALTGPGC